MLKVKNLHASVDGKEILRGSDLDVRAGEVHAIMGPNGSGKSTLLRTLAGLEPIQGGTISINNQVIDAGKPGTERAGRSDRSSELRTRIGMVFQSYDLFPNKTVLGNITMAPVLVQKRDKSEVEAEAIRLLGRGGRADRKDSWPHELSGGQRQRLCIARALLKKPKILILDDSTSAVDTKTDQLIRAAFHHEIPDTTKIIIAQRVASVQESDMILVMDHGRIMAAGTHEQLLENCDEYRSIYESQTQHQAQPEELQ